MIHSILEPEELKENNENSITISDEVDICCICLENLNTTDNYIYSICNHKIHSKCHDVLIINKNNRCPLCRVKEPKEIKSEPVFEAIHITNYNIRINAIFPEELIDREITNNYQNYFRTKINIGCILTYIFSLFIIFIILFIIYTSYY